MIRSISILVAAVSVITVGQGAFAQRLDELTIEQAERQLLVRNREIQLARRSVDSAQANTLIAGARPNPTLSLGVSAINPSLGVGSGNYRDKTLDSSLRVDQLIERGQKRELRIAVSKNLELATGEDLTDVLRQQRLALRSAYYDLLLAQDKEAVLRDTAALFQETLKAAEVRLRAGDLASADVARIRVDALRSENDLRSAQAERSRAQIALAYLIGAEPEAKRIRAADAWPQMTGDAMPAVSDEMIERRPDVRAAAMRVEASESGRSLSKSLRVRDVSVGVQYDHYPSGPANTLGGGNSYGVFMSVPLFVRYYYEGDIARAEADYGAAQDNIERVRAQARSELERALSDLRAAAERLRRYDATLLVEAKKAADAAEFAYKNGAIGVMDLLDARRTLRATQVDAVGARSDFAKALSAWQSGSGSMN